MSEVSARVDQRLWDRARAITEDVRYLVDIYYALEKTRREAIRECRESM